MQCSSATLIKIKTKNIPLTISTLRAIITTYRYSIHQIPFLENALKKTTEYFLKFLFLFESTIFPVNKNGWPCSSLHDRSNLQAH